MRSIQKGQIMIAMGVAAMVLFVFQHSDSSSSDTVSYSAASDEAVHQEVPAAAKSVLKYEREAALVQGSLMLKLEEVDNTDLVASDDPKERMDARKRHLQKACQGMVLDADVSEQRDLEITIAYGHLKLCGMEKTASTFMKDIRAKERPTDAVKDFKSFIIVREPYSRLVSGYVDKMYSRAGWWGMYGGYMVDQFRYRPSKHEAQCGSNVTFPEFVRYWIHASETDRKQDGHFRAMHKTCRMCYWDYDYYVHLETIGGDISYIYNSVNISLERPMSDDLITLKDKAADIMGQRDRGSWGECETACNMLDRTWWTFHARGLVAPDIPQPFQGDQCNTVTKDEFMNAAVDAHEKSKNRINKSQQRRQMMMDLYLQVPLLDRLKVRDILLKDFKLHGYDPTPTDMFPELFKN